MLEDPNLVPHCTYRNIRYDPGDLQTKHGVSALEFHIEPSCCMFLNDF